LGLEILYASLRLFGEFLSERFTAET